MSDNQPITKFYDDLSKLIKIILQIFLGGLVSGVYRILRYIDTKNVTALVIGILCLITPLSLIFWIIDLVTVITNDKISVCA